MIIICLDNNHSMIDIVINITIQGGLMMYEGHIPLSLLPLGGIAEVKKLTMGGNIRRRMLDLGLINGTKVQAINRSPSGDPVAYYFRGAVIALRSEEATGIIVERL